LNVLGITGQPESEEIYPVIAAVTVPALTFAPPAFFGTQSRNWPLPRSMVRDPSPTLKIVFSPTFCWGSAVKEERRILIVDDDRDSTHLLKILLEKTGGYVVLEENDAAKAHQSAHNFRPDLILLDSVMMPQIDGVELASEIDADPQLQRTPIIFLTALGDARAGLRIQGHPVLAKPINVPDLINRLEENLPVP
jgi:CheY-like chemotaxis protein